MTPLKPIFCLSASSLINLCTFFSIEIDNLCLWILLLDILIPLYLADIIVITIMYHIHGVYSLEYIRGGGRRCPEGHRPVFPPWIWTLTLYPGGQELPPQNNLNKSWANLLKLNDWCKRCMATLFILHTVLKS